MSILFLPKFYWQEISKKVSLSIRRLREPNFVQNLLFLCQWAKMWKLSPSSPKKDRISILFSLNFCWHYAIFKMVSLTSIWHFKVKIRTFFHKLLFWAQCKMLSHVTDRREAFFILYLLWASAVGKASIWC